MYKYDDDDDDDDVVSWGKIYFVSSPRNSEHEA
jgi:hypothetical protein